MPYDANGVWSLTAGYLAVTGQVVSPTNHNPPLEDISTNGLSAVLVRDGRAPMTGNLNMGTTNKITNLANGTAAADGVNKSQLDASIANLSSRGFLWGLTLSNNGADATNDIDIAIGSAADETASPWIVMNLASTLTKRLDATWAVGTNQGGLDTGSIANTTYHVWLIQRSDTGVVDALFSTSATAPTMPTNYDRKRRIGSIIRDTGAIVLFAQNGDIFRRKTSFAVAGSTATIADQLFPSGVPVGIVCAPILRWQVVTNANSVYIGSLGSAAFGASDTAVIFSGSTSNPANRYQAMPPPIFFSNTSGEIWISRTVSSGTVANSDVANLGWVDRRGKDG